MAASRGGDKTGKTGDKPRTEKPEQKTPSTRKRAAPTPTIDLKAQEVAEETKSAPAKDAKPAETKPSGTKSIGAKPAAAKAETAKSEPETPEKGPETETTEAPKPNPETKPETKAEKPRPAAAPSKPSPAAIAQKEAPRSRPGLTGLAAVLGGAIGGGIVYALLTTGIVPSPRDAGMEGQIASLESRISGLQGEIPDVSGLATEQGLGNVESRIGTLETQLAGSGRAGDVSMEIADLTARLDALVNAMPDEPGAAITELDTRLSNISDALQTERERFAEIAATLDTMAERSGAADASAFSGRLAALDAQSARLDAIEATIQRLAVDLPATVETVRLETDAIRGLIADVNASLEDIGDRQVTLGERVTTFEAGVADTATAIAALQAEAATDIRESQAALAAAFASLQRAADAGGPFREELLALQDLGGSAIDLSALTPLAGSGAPSAVRLQSQFQTIISAILDASPRPEGAGEGVLARLAANAQSIVRVRPTGYVSGDTPDAIVARIEVLLADGRFEEARSEWEKLGGDAKSASTDWAEGLRQRIAVDAAVADLTKAVATAPEGMNSQ